MKSFNLEMLDSSGVDNKIAAKVHGQGTVEFDTVPVEYERILKLRKYCAKQFEEANTGAEDFTNDKAVELAFALAIHLLQEVVRPNLDSDQATKLIVLTGGIKGSLAPQLAIRYGISDIILNNEDDGGDQDEIPT